MIEQPPHLYIPAYSITPNRVVLFSKYDGPKSSKSLKKLENLKDNDNTYNELSENAHRRLMRSLDYMVYISGEKTNKGNIYSPEELATIKTIQSEHEQSVFLEKTSGYIAKKAIKYKMTFITLTLASKQIHTDNEIKATLLNQFLIELRSQYKVNVYIWKAEKQANGNIHFHILTNQYIHWRLLRSLWNRIQEKLGYVTRYQENMKTLYQFHEIKNLMPSEYHKQYIFKPTTNNLDGRSVKKQYEAFLIGCKTNFTDPNSTDIHAIYKVKDIQLYMVKYMGKDVLKDGVLRIEKMKKIKEKIDTYTFELNSMIYSLAIDPQRYALIETLLFQLKSEFEELKNKGVDGRIWGQSQILSKFRPVSDIGTPEEMDEIIKHAKGIYYNDISELNKVVTYIVDFSLIPSLKQNYDYYIYQTIHQNTNRLDIN